MRKSDLEKWWKKFWFFVWKDDSPKGWIVSIIFLFVVIKFIFFPVLSLLTGTALPLAIVESCSMYHEGNLISNYDAWWERHSEKYSEFSHVEEGDFSEFDFHNGFNKGDILFILGVKPEKLEVGDVIIFQTERSTPIIHRIIEVDDRDGKKVFSTMGDNNKLQLQSEKNIDESQIIGKAVLRPAPYLGWIKLIFFEPLRNPSERGFCEES